jgi:microcystin-dependent protein
MDPFIGEIRMMGFNFPPKGWASCNGQLMNISQNTALFSILGTSYGGDGKNTFGLPNFQGSVPVGVGQGAGLSPYVIGQRGGTSTVTLNSAQVAQHSHAFGASAGDGNSQSAAASTLANGIGIAQYAASSGTPVPLGPNMLAPVGNGQPHNNLMPYCTLQFAIALQGVYPSRG